MNLACTNTQDRLMCNRLMINELNVNLTYFTKRKLVTGIVFPNE
ncbi:hypothetical protein Fluta_0168 [Fluviicola taffensis DSM 16823]|uniref:Uncharacterized protein n=1 Tax=Fluviicola taffensis (strain DSM 16823 / NCIMB 13979 / RW262) TaxID=755732 RepID=F2IBU9_FLUTR|nr:hypothetical protein Fluta_0168 [Fluviicola taffensis DSM 16823]